MGQVDEQTRLVALATNHFLAGFRPDLEAIGQYLRERNILFGVDAIQTLGAFPCRSSTWISWRRARKNGCSAPAARAFFMCANRSRKNCVR